MKKSKHLLVLTLAALAASSLSGCFGKTDNGGGGDGGGEQEVSYFNFSVGLKSGGNAIALGTNNDSLVIYDNGIDTNDRSYSYSSTNNNVARIDASGKITPVSEGSVNFRVTEAKSGITKALKKNITITPSVAKSEGGYNFSGGTTTPELEERTEILGKLEKYAMDTHLTGITLFENGGLVKYDSRVQIPTKGKQYIEGYGFGILTDGELEGTLSGPEGSNYPTYYHSSISQDSLKINQYSATGSQVSDLAGYITSSYWGTRLNNAKDNYEWYPVLATDEVKVPTFAADGTVASYASTKTKNNQPIPAEAPNATNLYKKWRIYVKTDGDVNGSNLKYSTASSKLAGKGFNGRGVTIEDYEFIYQLLFTGSNNIIRGTEMANDTSYGIKGAQRFFNDTSSMYNPEAIESKWGEYKDSNKLGIKTGSDVNGAYIDLELINAIDAFTAMYTLSSSLTSPLPKDLFVGDKRITPGSGEKAFDETKPIKERINAYGTFNGGSHDAILDYTLCLGAYTLTKWEKLQKIVFARDDNWFETPNKGGNRYKIPGVYYRVYQTDTDTEKTWKQFEDAHNLDSAGVPTSKVESQRGKPNVYETKGDATFKLNVNSCDEAEWNKLFGPEGTVHPNAESWNLKPWMANSDFLDGLFFSIDREAFARKRGVNPSIDYFSNAYQMRNAEGGSSYNSTEAHRAAVAGYSDNYGYNLNKAIDCFRNAVKQLSSQRKLVLGPSKSNPTEIHIHIRWMYQTDIKEYGEDIKSYFETAFNNDAVCGGRVKLVVDQDAVTNWEEVYNEWMMQGRFDLAFGAISGNTYNPLNFMEVLKSDNSSSFTLNWGTDTSKVDEKNPIIYKGQKWSYDALWEVADHGGIVDGGEKVDPVKYCHADAPTNYTDTLSEGFKIEFPVEFASFDKEGGKAEFDINRVDCYVFGRGNVTLAEKGSGNLVYDAENHVIRVTVTKAIAESIRDAIKEANTYKDTDDEQWHKDPFIMERYMNDFAWEVYYELSINGGSASVNYAEVTASDN